METTKKKLVQDDISVQKPSKPKIIWKEILSLKSETLTVAAELKMLEKTTSEVSAGSKWISGSPDKLCGIIFMGGSVVIFYI